MGRLSSVSARTIDAQGAFGDVAPGSEHLSSLGRLAAEGVSSHVTF